MSGTWNIKQMKVKMIDGLWVRAGTPEWIHNTRQNKIKHEDTIVKHIIRVYLFMDDDNNIKGLNIKTKVGIPENKQYWLQLKFFFARVGSWMKLSGNQEMTKLKFI